MKKKHFDHKSLCHISVAISILFFLSPNMSLAKVDFPTKPIELVCGYSPGGSSDSTMRALAKAAEKDLGQPVVVVNQPGASSVIALHATMDKKPDGYSLVFLGASATAFHPRLRQVRYNPVRDFTPIMQYGAPRYPLSVQKEAPWNTFQEFIAHSKKNPNVTIGCLSGGAQLACMKRIEKKEGIQWKFVPYPSSRGGIMALLGGHVDAALGSGEGATFARAGKLKFLVIITEDRFEEFPDVPTLKDLGYPYSGIALFSIVGPKGIPQERVEILDNAFRKAMSNPEFLKMMKNINVDIKYRNSKELGAYIKKIYDENADIKEVFGKK